MKCVISKLLRFAPRSLPSWERGLKSQKYPIYSYPGRVAPLVGARVEMAVHTTQQNASRVAPLVGARVEMSRKVSHVKGTPVAPLVGARVEICEIVRAIPDNSVAPLVGARVEMFADIKAYFDGDASLPSWERGLKSQKSQIACIILLSLPSWERGLK